ncbi:MAG: hypothetical protein AAF798_16385 [Bacteroidota bacterium]
MQAKSKVPNNHNVATASAVPIWHLAVTPTGRLEGVDTVGTLGLAGPEHNPPKGCHWASCSPRLLFYFWNIISFLAVT